MIAGPPRHLADYDNQGRERSLLLKKIQGGKMELPENNAQTSSEGYLPPEDITRKFCAGFLDEAQCRRWILERLHPKGAFCPECGQELAGRCEDRFWENTRVRCPRCRRQFTALKGTMFQGIHMSFGTIMLLALFLAMNQPARTVAELLNIDQETVRVWRRRFDEVRVLVNR
jgi:transposase-like protein